MNPPLIGSSDRLWCEVSFDGVTGLVSVEVDPDRAFLVFPSIHGNADPKRYREIMDMVEELKREGVAEQFRAVPLPLQALVQQDVRYKGRAGDLFRFFDRKGVVVKVLKFGKVAEHYDELAVVVSELGPWIVEGACFNDYNKFIVVGTEKNDPEVPKGRGRGGVSSKWAQSLALRVSGVLRSQPFLRCARCLGLPFFTLCMSAFGLLVALKIDVLLGLMGFALSFIALSLIAYRTECA